jgi:hypothetical protein
MDGAGSGGELVSSEKVLAWRQAGGGGEAAEGVVSGRWPRAREFCCGGEMDFWSGTRHSELGPQNSKQATVGPKQTVNMRAEGPMLSPGWQFRFVFWVICGFLIWCRCECNFIS